MKAMARQRSHSIEFKRQVAQEFIAGESPYGLSKRHDISRQLIRVWVEKHEAGALDEDAQAADLLQEYEAKIAALERMVGRQALEIEFQKGALKNAARPRNRLCVLGCDPRCLVSSRRRLRHQSLDRCAARCCCTQSRHQRPQSTKRLRASFRPWVAICLRRLSRRLAKARSHRLHGAARQSLRQRQGRELHENTQ